jgi:hypothetical protein
MKINTFIHVLILIAFTIIVLAQEKRIVMEPIKDIRYTFKGAIGDRIDANINNWFYYYFDSILVRTMAQRITSDHYTLIKHYELDELSYTQSLL